jgi:hypothetical protein
MSSNLVAKSIIDKNGRSTTVHVSLGKLTGNDTTSGDKIWTSSKPPQLPSTPGVYQFTISASRFEKDVMLPRKRNPRDITYTDHIVVDVPDVESSDAPVSLTAGDTEYRVFDDTMYKKLTLDEGKTVVQAEDFFAGGPQLANDYDSTSDYYPHQPDYEKVFNEHANDFIVIEGEVYKKTGEPKYLIDTNHYIWGDTMEIKVTDDNHGSNDRLFSALERDVAIARANEILDGMPETTSSFGGGERTSYHHDSAEESIKNLPVIEVEDPSVVGLTYEFPARVTVPHFSTYEEGDYSNGNHDAAVGERFNTAMTSYKETIDSVPGAVSVSDSGARKINWEKLPAELKYEYTQAAEWAVKNGYLF